MQRAYGTPLQQDYARYEYTLNGKQKAVIDANNNRAEMSWDGFDRQKRWIFPSKTGPGANPADYEEYLYDAVGNRISLRKRDGAVIGYQYDALNRMIFKDVPEAGGDVAYAYDVRGLQLSALYSATGLGIASFYDGFGRQTSSTTNLDGTSRTYAFQYDAAGNRSRVAHPDGPWFDYAHDALGRMRTLKDSAGTTLVTLTYHPAGERASATYANGVATGYDYDKLGRLTGLTHDFAGTAQDVAYSYSYNPASQIASRTIGNDLYVFTKSATSIAYAANGLNQYVQVAGGSVDHDPNGNLISQGGRTIAYDSENKLVSASSTAGGSPFALGYDPQGRFRAIFGGATTIGFDMVGTDIVTLRINAGPPLERYAFGPGPDEPMIGYDNAGTRYYFHADGHGNIVANSNSAGTATRTIGYDDYGRPSTFASTFLHAGKIHLGTLNAYYNNARFYDYTLGRFLQTDPVAYDDQINLYAYVGNDPVNGVDPTGLAGECDTGSKIPGNSGGCRVVEGYAIQGRAAAAGRVTTAARAAVPARIVVGATSVGAVATAGALASTLLLCGDSAGGCSEPPAFWFLTYTKTRTVGDDVTTYSGRTSGYGSTPQTVLARRDSGHHMNAAGFGRAQVDRAVRSVATVNDVATRMAIRGREQMLIDHFGGARSEGGTSGNAINGISPYNPLRGAYIGAAEAMFGSDF